MRKLLSSIFLFLLFSIFFIARTPDKAFAGNCAVQSVSPYTIASRYKGSLTVTLDSSCSPVNEYRVCAYNLASGGAQFACEHGLSDNADTTNLFVSEDIPSTSTKINVPYGATNPKIGDWQIEVCECKAAGCGTYDCSGNDNQVSHFSINDNTGLGTISVSPPPPPCATLVPGGGCDAVDTGLGQWSTNPENFVNKLFRVLLSISGAIAVISIMLAGYRMLMSQGDPEKVQGARESITAAIVGLLFLIFSLVILQVIGVDILHLPGFGQ